MKVTALVVKLKMEPLSPSLSFLDFLNQTHIDFAFFLLRGQHEFILRLVSLSTIFFVVCRGPCLHRTVERRCSEPCTRQPSAGLLRPSQARAHSSTRGWVLY